MPTGFLTALLLVVFGAILILATVVARYQRATYTRYLLICGILAVIAGTALLEFSHVLG